MFRRQSQISPPGPGTCRWIHELDAARSWGNGVLNIPNILYIGGTPGTGKSTMISYLSQLHLPHLEGRRDLMVLSFFFSAQAENIDSSYEGLLRSLLYQFYQGARTIRAAIRPYLEERAVYDSRLPEILRWESCDLETALLTAIRNYPQLKLVVFIDAFDEANADEANRIAAFLQRLSAVRDTNEQPNYRPRICISCRYFPIRDWLPGQRVSMEDNNDKDIIDYLEHNLSPAQMYGGDTLDPVVWRNIVDDVKEKASCSFQWATLVVQVARKLVSEGQPTRVLQSKLLSLPVELGETYRYILTNVIDPEHLPKTLNLLQWICLGEQALTITQLRYAMTIETAMATNSSLRSYEVDEFVETDQQMKLQVQAVSGGLVSVYTFEDGRPDYLWATIVHVVHQSFQDFMVKHGGFHFLASIAGMLDNDSVLLKSLRVHKANENLLGLLEDGNEPALIISACHHRMFLACQYYILEDEAQVPGTPQDPAAMFRRQPSFEHYARLRPFLAYAVPCLFRCANRARLLHNAVGCDWQTLYETFPTVFKAWERLFRLMETDHLSRYPPAEKMNLLHVAAKYGLEEIASCLLDSHEFRNSQDKMCYINCLNSKQKSPLHYAAGIGYPKIVSLLLQHGAHPDAPNADGLPPLVDMMRHLGQSESLFAEDDRPGCNGNLSDYLEIAKTLTQACRSLVHSSMDMLDALRFAARNGSTEMVNLLLDMGVDIDGAFDHRDTALIAATDAGCTEVVRLLLRRGANIHRTAGEFGTALIAASFREHIEILFQLIDQNADIEQAAGRYGTALAAASHMGHDDVVEYLLELGADINQVAGDSYTALVAAVSKGQKQTVELLIERGADVHYSGRWYGSALRTAVETNRPEIAQVLWDAGARLKEPVHLNTLTRLAESANLLTADLLCELWHSCNDLTRLTTYTINKAKSEDLELLELLLHPSMREWVNQECLDRALYAAARDGRLSSLKLLHEAGADVNLGTRSSTSTRNWPNSSRSYIEPVFTHGQGSALEVAIERSHTDCVKFLIDHGADVNGRSPDHGTELIGAIKARFYVKPGTDSAARVLAVSLLLDAGADLLGRDHNGLSPMQVAKFFDFDDIVDMLKVEGVKQGYDWDEKLHGPCLELPPADSRKNYCGRDILYLELEKMVTQGCDVGYGLCDRYYGYE